jgi:hypothetical protein
VPLVDDQREGLVEVQELVTVPVSVHATAPRRPLSSENSKRTLKEVGQNHG